jgi:hypothetical protein
LAFTPIEDNAANYGAGGKSRRPIAINSARLVVHG